MNRVVACYGCDAEFSTEDRHARFCSECNAVNSGVVA